MKKIVAIVILLVINYGVFAQNTQASDISTPELSPFAMDDGSLQGAIANSVEEVTGKVVTSIPIANINARTISYPVTLTYNGKDVFKQAQYLNQYRAQSTLGIGWSLNVPKIITDHKGTSTREDDTFYFVNGGGPNRLICTTRNMIEIPSTGDSYWDFKTEQFLPYKVRYRIEDIEIINSVYVTIPRDYWEVTDDKGVVYTYGRYENARENVIAWDNWIGDSKNVTGALEHTIVWNLSKIEDQWGNTINFYYEKVQQGINTTGPTHTEASYISEISSSTGNLVYFGYDDKTSLEYYEPHREQTEPDAYQERYEKKYLATIDTFDDASESVYTYELDYDYVLKALGDRKQYLKSVTQKDKDGNALPSQEFEYYTSGTFAGGIKKIVYPAGGSITYNYQEKTAFDSSNIPIEIEGTLTSGYSTIGRYAGNDFGLRVMREGDWSYNGRADYRLKVLSDYWVGQKWKRSEFIFPELVQIDEYNNIHTVDNLRFVSGEDFYGFMIFNASTHLASLYLFHREQNGVSWKKSEFRDLAVYGGALGYANEKPVLISGEKFVAIGENRGGELYTFVWNGDGWSTDIIQQGTGQYYYGANNNFIISLDERDDGSSGDMVTGVTSHPDNYYIHYLDASLNWTTKSWSNDVFQNFPHVVGTDDPSYLYPSNNMAGFMAENNPEYIIRWDENYNLVGMDNELGAYTDTNTLIPVGSNNFTLFETGNSAPSLYRQIKSIAFDGSSWQQEPFSGNHGQGVGNNFMLTSLNEGPFPSYQKYLHSFDPNSNQWSNYALGPIDKNKTTAIAGNLFLAGGYAYYKENTGVITSLGDISNYEFIHLATNNADNIVASFSNPPGSAISQRSLFYMDKTSGTLQEMIIPNNSFGSNSSIKQLGGTSPLFSPKLLYTHPNFSRIIDAKVNTPIKNTVVSYFEIDDGKGEVRKVFYTYNDSHTLPDDQSTFYGEVIVENKGFGTGNNGKTIKYFKKGDEDIREAGLPIKVEIKDKNDAVKSESETQWNLVKTYYASTAGQVGFSYYIRPTKQIEKVKLNNIDMITETDNTYNPKGYLTHVSTTNSKGLTELTSMSYAYENPASGVTTALKNRNMLAFPYQTLNYVGGEQVSVERSEWTNSGSDYYVNEIKSGVNLTALRTDTEITRIDSYGNVQESNNGVEVYKTVLYGYDNLYPVATITNAKFDDVISELNVSYTQLQNLNATALETELLTLYDQLPEAMINVYIYDDQGRVVKTFDERKESVSHYYDSFGRLEYTLDSAEKVIQKRQYNIAGN